jgi:phage tail-like protein
VSASTKAKSLAMSLKKESIKTAYPLPAYNYKVIVGSETLPFSEVSGLTLEYEKVSYKHGFSFLFGTNIIRGQRQAITITLKRGIVAKRKDLYNWLQNKTVKDIAIDLCDQKGDAVVRWKVSKATVLKMETSGFNAGGNEIAVESVELAAQDLNIEYL